MIHSSSLRCLPKTLLFGLFCVLATLAQAQVGANWRLLNPKPWSDTLTSVAAINTTRVIATGRGTGLLISTDAGATWTATRVDFNADFSADAYVASSGATRQILVVGNRVFTATTGEDWTEVATNLASNETLSLVIARGSGWAAIKKTRDDSTGSEVYSVAFGNAAGDTWTVLEALPLVSTNYNSISALVLQGSTYIVAGSFSNNTMSHAEPILLRALNGVGWTATTLNGANDSWTITSLANSGTVLIAAGDDNVYRSADAGVTWTRYAISSISRVSWNGSRFVGASGTVSRYSTDGITWTNSTTPYGALNPLAMAKVGTNVVAVGESGSIFTTPDGDVWTQRAPTGATGNLRSIATNPAGVRVAFSSDGTIQRTADGNTWTTSSGRATAAVWHGSQFVGINQSKYVSSSDGITWTDHFDFGADDMHAVASNGTTVVAVGDDGAGSGVIYSSNDPTAGWTAATVPSAAETLYAVTRSGSTWVAVGSNLTILTSTNGTTWTKRAVTGDYSFDLRAVAGNSTGTFFVALGINSGGVYYTSTNGTAWTRRQLPAYLDIWGAVWTGSNFIISTSSNIAFTSPDGINWTSRPLSTGNVLMGMGWDPTLGEAFILGDSGTILSSDAVPEATFALKSQGVFESTVNAAVQVNLTIPPTTAITVPFTISGTAVDGTDFTSFATTDVTFAAGETSKAINVTLVNDALSETDKTIVFTLGTTTGMRVGQISKHTLTILDDDGPLTVQFVGSAVSVPETVGTIGLQLALNRPTPNEITVPVSVSGDAAPALTLGVSSVTIPVGASTAFVSVAVAPNSSVTVDQIATVALGTPNLGTAGANRNFTITVLDQDPATTPGRRWTLQQQKPSADALWALTTIPGATPRVVAVGDGGTVVTSDDSGATWTKRFTNVRPDLQYVGVHWNGSFVIAAGTGGHIGVSPDGIGWNDLVVPGASGTLGFNSVASTGTRMVAVGGELVGDDTVPVIYSSQDSVHWSRVGLPGGMLGDLRSVIYVSGTTSEFIAVGSNYDFNTGKASTLILTSPNGLSWTNRSAALPGIDLSSVVAAGSTLVAFDGSKSAYSGVISPTDGSITWTKRTLGTIGGLAYGAWTGSKLAAVGGATGTSANGIAWVQKASPSKNVLTDICWTGSKFVALAYPSGIYTSTDGVTWTPPATAETSLPLIAVAWSGTQFCAVGGDPERVKTALIYTSPDGLTWTQRPSTLKVPLFSITWNGAQFCAVGANGTIVTSTNGVVWTPRNSGTKLDLHDVIWATNQYVVVGGNEPNEDDILRAGGSILLTSKDGTTWTRRAIPTAHPLEGIAYNPSAPISFGPPVIVGPQFVAVGRSSFDGGTGDAESSKVGMCGKP